METIIIRPGLLKLILIAIVFLIGVILITSSILLLFKQNQVINYLVSTVGIFVGLAISVYCVASATSKIQLTPISLVYSSIFGTTRAKLSLITNLEKASARTGRILIIYYSQRHKSISQFSFSYKQLKFIEKYLLHHCHELASNKE